jgi:nitrite reductase/ring-hydroxylating ferredoxin subunit
MLSSPFLLSRLVSRRSPQLLKRSLAPFSITARAMAQEYKIKGLSSLDLKSGEKREVEVEGIENGKILLARVGSKTHAMSSNCTHYGAPLKLGVLTPDGRLTCAWHGGWSMLKACKNSAC